MLFSNGFPASWLLAILLSFPQVYATSTRDFLQMLDRSGHSVNHPDGSVSYRIISNYTPLACFAYSRKGYSCQDFLLLNIHDTDIPNLKPLIQIVHESGQYVIEHLCVQDISFNVPNRLILIDLGNTARFLIRLGLNGEFRLQSLEGVVDTRIYDLTNFFSNDQCANNPSIAFAYRQNMQIAKGLFGRKASMGLALKKNLSLHDGELNPDMNFLKALPKKIVGTISATEILLVNRAVEGYQQSDLVSTDAAQANQSNVVPSPMWYYVERQNGEKGWVYYQDIQIVRPAKLLVKDVYTDHSVFSKKKDMNLPGNKDKRYVYMIETHIETIQTKSSSIQQVWFKVMTLNRKYTGWVRDSEIIIDPDEITLPLWPESAY